MYVLDVNFSVVYNIPESQTSLLHNITVEKLTTLHN